VHGECSRLTESLAAVVALEGFLFAVNVAMISQMVLTTESFSANVTAIRTLIRMRSLVNEKIVGFGELTIAVFADELFLWTCSSRASHF
jgi:hypothetical protein